MSGERKAESTTEQDDQGGHHPEARKKRGRICHPMSILHAVDREPRGSARDRAPGCRDSSGRFSERRQRQASGQTDDVLLRAPILPGTFPGDHPADASPCASGRQQDHGLGACEEFQALRPQRRAWKQWARAPWRKARPASYGRLRCPTLAHPAVSSGMANHCLGDVSLDHFARSTL